MGISVSTNKHILSNSSVTKPEVKPMEVKSVEVKAEIKPVEVKPSEVKPMEVIKTDSHKLFENLEEFDENSRFVSYFRFAPRLMKAIRPLAYASEVGESFRHITPQFIKASYGLSFLYVFMDIGVKTGEVYLDKDLPEEKKKITMFCTAFDKSLFHLSASIAVPAILIHQTVKRSGQGLNFVKDNQKFNTYLKSSNSTRTLGLLHHHRLKFVPVVLGLCTIPFIIGPIDHGTDWVLDNTTRKYCYDGYFKRSSH